MRVNSDETLRRAIAMREADGRSWLEILRDPEQQRFSRDFFSGERRQEVRPARS
jgi:hypothetical protein